MTRTPAAPSFLPDADIIFCAARAGTQVLSKQQLSIAKKTLVLADVNAVPPAGLEGVGIKDDDKKHDSGGLSIGTGQVGTVTVETVQRPVGANIFATGQVGTVTVEDTRNETITVG